MARDGTGVMSVPYPDFQAGTVIDDSQMDANFADVVSELTNSIPRDGQAAPTADIPFGNYKITGLGAGTAAAHSANLGQIQAQAYIWGGTAGGSKNALTLTPTPAITAYAAGQSFVFLAGATQSDDAVTVAVSGLATKAIQNNGSALSSTVFIEAGKLYRITYDGTQFQLSKQFSPDGKFLDSATYGGFTTGDVKLTLKTSADTGWILADDGTIGDASSGGTTRANADTSALYILLWTNVSDTYAPVTGGRGASAAADFAAHKPIALTKMLGRALAVAGAGSGLTSRALGLTVGAETHALSEAELAEHDHSITDPGHTHTVTAGPNNTGGQLSTINFSSEITVTTTSSTTGITVNNAGSGTAHNNMQPSSFLNVMIKL